MEVGLETYDANGNLIFDSDDLMTIKYLGSVTVTYSGQTVTDDRLGQGNAFVFAVAWNGSVQQYIVQENDAYGVVSGNTITFYIKNITSATFIYGVY